MSEEKEFRKVLSFLEKRSLSSFEEEPLSELRETCLLFYRHLQKQKETESQTEEKKNNLAKVLFALIQGECERLSPSERKKILSSEEYKLFLSTLALKGVALPQIVMDEEEEVPSLTEDFNLIEEDRNYEFFFIQDRQDDPYFHPSIVKQLMQIALKEGGIKEEKGELDPLLQIRKVIDHALHELAKKILTLMDEEVHAFYKEAMQYKLDPVVAYLNNALMALRMAANPKSLVGTQGIKNAIEYYTDFHHFLRQALEAKAENREDSSFERGLEKLLYFASFLFFRAEEPKEEMTQLLLELGMKKGKQEIEIATFDSIFREKLSLYPQGPLMKLIDLLQQQEERMREGFDPLSHGNLPSKLFDFVVRNRKIHVLRIPCPTRQTHIDRCEIVPEFLAFLSYGKEILGKKQGHLLINLQNGSSWKEAARCRRLQFLAKQAQFQGAFFLMEVNPEFDFELKEGEKIETEFFFTKLCDPSHLIVPSCIEEKNIKKIFNFVHSSFFPQCKKFSLKEISSFRDIFVLFLVFKVVEKEEIFSMSFSSKDALDEGASYSALFYAMLHFCFGLPWKKEQLIWLLYGPSLIVRERPIRKAEMERWRAGFTLLEKKGKLEKRVLEEYFPELKLQ